jgi:hypothetical protein
VLYSIKTLHNCDTGLISETGHNMGVLKNKTIKENTKLQKNNQYGFTYVKILNV